MAYTQGPVGGLGRARADWDPFASIPEEESYPLRGLRPTYAEEFPTGGSYMEAVSPPPGSGLQRGYEEYAKEKGLQAKPRAEYARAYGQALEEIRGTEPMVLPEPSADPMGNWKQARKQYLHVINKAREMGATPEETQAELRHWGVDKIDPMNPPVAKTTIPYEYGGKLYNLTPEQYADMPGVKKKEEKAPGTIETADGVFQWNPESNRFDIPLGKGKGSLKEIKEIAKEEKAAKKEEARLQMAMTKANLVMGKVDEALGQVGYGTAGFGGAVLGKVPGTPAVDLDETLDTIRANIGFNELSEMRQASPTGGALGQVAVRELELLTSALGSLNRKQGPAQLTKNLESIKAHYANWKAAVDEAAQPSAAKTGGGKTVTVRNPTTGEMETWDLTTEQRVQ